MAKIANPMNGRHLEHNDHQDANIARKGSVPKRTNDALPVHSGMTARQISAANLGGMGHPSATVDGGQSIAASSAAAPLAHSYGSLPNTKHGKPVPIHPSQSRGAKHEADMHELGRATIAEAFAASAADDCSAHSRNRDGSK
jgi:hypothetical protein